MPSRTSKFAPAIFASLFAAVPLATISFSAAAECLSGPKDQAPEGSHWYYRVDHSSSRHCWYLRPEGGKSAQVAARPAPSKTEPSPQDSIADARAELPVPTTRVEQETVASPWPSVAAAPAKAAGPANSPASDSPYANVSASVVASRWPAASEIDSSTGPAASVENPAAAAPSDSQATPRPVEVDAVSLAAAEAPFEKQSRSTLMLLIAIGGALSFAGLMGRAIFRSAAMRRQARRRVVRGERRAIWDSIVTEHPPASSHAMPDTHIPTAHIPTPSRDSRVDSDPDRRIADMLARLSRSAAA